MNLQRLFNFLRPINPFHLLRVRVTPWAARFIPAKAEWMVIGSLLFALPFLWKSTPLTMARDMLSSYDLKNDPDSRFFAEFKKTFPNEFFLIAFERENLFSAGPMTVLGEITSQLDDLEDVRRVVSLANANVTEGAGDDFMVRKFLETLPQDAAGWERLKGQATTHRIFSKSLVSSDGRTTAILVFPRINDKDVEFRSRILERSQKILAPYEAQGYRFHLGGTTAINVALSDYNYHDISRFTIFMYVFLIGTLWFVFRNVRLVALAVFNIFMVVTCVRGFAGWMGLAMNNFSLVALPLSMALALSDTTHVFTHLDRQFAAQTNRRSALAGVLRSIMFPCFLTSLNTALGFLSLTLNRVNGLHEFGLLAAAGMGFEFIFTFFLTAPLLLMFDPKHLYRDTAKPQAGAIAKLLQRVDALVHARPRAIVLSTAILAAVAFGFALRLKVDTNVYNFFHSKDPWRQSLAFIEDRLAGVEGIDISLQAEEPGAFQDPRNLQVIQKLQTAAAGLPSIDQSLSLVNYLEMINQSFHGEDSAFHRLPESRNMVEQFMLLYGREDVEDFVSADYRHARILLRSRAHSTADQAPLLEELTRLIETTPHPGLTIKLTGQAVNDHNTAKAVVTDMSSSIISSICGIALVMLLVLESVPLTLLFLVPNLLPILLNFGLMSVLGMSLSAGNALIAASAFGMIVDDTVHFFTAYSGFRGRGISLGAAVKRLIAEKGEASFSSFLVLFMAFAVMLTSTFKPTFQFGFLNIVVLLMGIASDQLLLNSLLIWMNRGGKDTGRKPESADVFAPEELAELTAVWSRGMP